MLPPPPRSTLFPYTTLFRSLHRDHPVRLERVDGAAVEHRSEIRNAQGNGCDGPGVQEQPGGRRRSEEHTSELQSLRHLVCRLLLEKKKKKIKSNKLVKKINK